MLSLSALKNIGDHKI